MYLAFIPELPEGVRFVAFDSNERKAHFFAGKKSAAVLAELVAWLETVGLSLKDIKGVAVGLERGSFTTTRVLTTIANTLGMAYRIPVESLTEEELGEQTIERLKKATIGKPLVARYSGMPNIRLKPREN